MRLEEFFNKFELFAEAPNAVGKMRELIFDLAATGKLMPEFLEAPVASDMSLMGEVVELIMGQAPPGNECNTDGDGTVFVKVGEFGDLYPERTVWTTKPLKMAKTGDVLICVVGATVGKLNLAIDCSIGRSVAAIRPSEKLNTKFLYYSLMPYTLRLRRNSRGSAQGVIGKAELNKILLWVPSIEMQQKVVAKVDELMALCDRLEAQQQERATRHAALARASLARFAADPTPANLEYLFHDAYDIIPADLRKTILTLAVQGRLVEQDSSDEPARSLLSQIVEEKRRLVAARVIRQQHMATPIAENEIPFAVPEGWAWARLSSITRRIHYGYTASANMGLNEVRLLRITDIQNNGVDWLSVPGCEIAKEDISQYQLERGDILVARTGGTVGKTYLVQDIPVIAVFASYLIRIQGSSLIFDRYLKLFLESPIYWVQLEDGARGAAQPNVNGQTLGRMVVSVPPIAEQHRIVAKVEQLMALVDQLETQLTASSTTAERLMGAMVAELTTQNNRDAA